MTRKEAYVFAIENEIKAANLYRMLEKSFNDEDLGKTFNHLASLEDIHKEKLIKAFEKEFAGEKLTYKENVLPVIHNKRDLNDPVRILEYAVDRENATSDQYESMAKESDDDEIKSFFHGLAREEKEHKELLETEINRIQGTMIWFDSSELNGLVEH